MLRERAGFAAMLCGLFVEGVLEDIDLDRSLAVGCAAAILTCGQALSVARVSGRADAEIMSL